MRTDEELNTFLSSYAQNEVTKIWLSNACYLLLNPVLESSKKKLVDTPTTYKSFISPEDLHHLNTISQGQVSLYESCASKLVWDRL